MRKIALDKTSKSKDACEIKEPWLPQPAAASANANECMMSNSPPPPSLSPFPPKTRIVNPQRTNGPASPVRRPSCVIVRPFRRRPLKRQTQNPGNYFWKKSDEHQTYLDFEEQLMIVQELKEQGLVSLMLITTATPLSEPSLFERKETVYLCT